MRQWVVLMAALLLAGCDRLGLGQGGSDSDRQASREARALDLEPKRVAVAELRRAARDDPRLARFYRATAWQPAWDSKSATSLLDALGEAPRHGLSARAFLKVDRSASPAAKEIALTKAALDYGSALARGLVDPKTISEIYELPRPNPELAGGLAAATAAGEVGDWLRSLAPQSDEYRALSDAYVRYAQQALAERGTAIVSGELIRPGERDPRVPRLAQALAGNGYVSGAERQTPDPQRYTPELVDAVKRLQSDYGIDSDGIVGPATLEVLNTSAADRARQLAVNLERLRWMDRNPPATRIDVNTAATELAYWRDGRIRDRRRVVVGQPDWETPQLQSPMFQLIANPSWTVPDSIYDEEIAPAGPGYLWKNNMVFRNGRVVQLPGPENSLGMVKFDLRNRHAIYLHDTPAKALFALNERHRSHGCVRVFDAIGFARLIAGDNGVLELFDKALVNGDEEASVPLRRQIPVRLFYHTAYADPSGAVRFRTDPYGWDDLVARALRLQTRARRTLRGHVGDIGP